MGCCNCGCEGKKKSIEEKIQDRINSLHGNDGCCGHVCDCVNAITDEYVHENNENNEHEHEHENNENNITLDSNEVYTVLDWIKKVATAEEIVDFFGQSCSDGDKGMWCDGFESCRDCKVSWLKSKWLG